MRGDQFSAFALVTQEQNVGPLKGIHYKLLAFLSPGNWIHFLTNLNPADSAIEAEGRWDGASVPGPWAGWGVGGAGLPGATAVREPLGVSHGSPAVPG